MTLKMFLFLRSDMKFGKGALIAQACHAVSSVIYKYSNCEEMKEYLRDTNNMHKIVLKILKEDIQTIEEFLKNSNIKYYSWLEMPENEITCICTVPVDNSTNGIFKDFTANFKLYN